MSTYETAPATLLVATACACCSRPLVDAKSVEAGVGPECRKKHGFDKPDVEIDLAAACEIAAALPADLSAEVLKGAATTRDLANRLVYRIAAEQDGPLVASMTNALKGLGFEKLAARITKRIATVKIDEIPGGYLVQVAYSDEHVEAMRKVPGRRFAKLDDGRKGDEVPATSKRALFDALTKLYPGKTARGPKGLFVLALAA